MNPGQPLWKVPPASLSTELLEPQGSLRTEKAPLGVGLSPLGWQSLSEQGVQFSTLWILQFFLPSLSYPKLAYSHCTQSSQMQSDNRFMVRPHLCTVTFFFSPKQQLSLDIPRIINYKWNLQVITLRCLVLLYRVSVGDLLTHSWPLTWG